MLTNRYNIFHVPTIVKRTMRDIYNESPTSSKRPLQQEHTLQYIYASDDRPSLLNIRPFVVLLMGWS